MKQLKAGLQDVALLKSREAIWLFIYREVFIIQPDLPFQPQQSGKDIYRGFPVNEYLSRRLPWGMDFQVETILSKGLSIPPCSVASHGC